MATDFLDRISALERDVADLRSSVYGDQERSRSGLAQDNRQLAQDMTVLRTVLYANVALTTLSIVLLLTLLILYTPG